MFELIVGLIAGLATPVAEPHIEKALHGVLLSDVPMAEGEFRVFCFVVLLAVAAVLVELGGGGSPFLVVFGGGLGLFGKRLFDAARKRSGSE